MNVLPGNDAHTAYPVEIIAVKELKCNHVRLCGIMIQINNCESMCLKVYIQYDGWPEDDKFAEYMYVLGEIQQLIHTYNPAHVIYGGTGI